MKATARILAPAFLLFWFLLKPNIVTAQQPFIKLIQPTEPGIVWSIGQNHLISWVDNIASPVNILLTFDDSHFITLATNVTGSTYSWNTTGFLWWPACKIKVESVSGTVYDISSNYFTLAPQAFSGYAVLHQPTGGEQWLSGHSYLISWEDNISDPLEVWLLRNGSYYSHLCSTSGSSFTWTIPKFFDYGTNDWSIGIYYFGSIQVYNLALSGNFKILPDASYIKLYQPSGGEKWAVGSSHLITWNADTPDYIPVSVGLVGPGAQQYSHLGDSYSSSYLWTINDFLPEGNYKIRVSFLSMYEDYSNEFYITKSMGIFVKVLQPNGNENWALGTTHLISWNDDFQEPVNIVLCNGSITDTIAKNVTGSTYYWMINDTIATLNNYKIKVGSSKDTSLFDKSDNTFRISKSGDSFIDVIQPNGHESWAKGVSYLISWNDNVAEPVNVVLNNGSAVDTLAKNVTGSTFSWLINDTTPAKEGYRIKVVSTKDADLVDRSDADFKITNTSAVYLEILQPNGGESWAKNTTHLISWIDDMAEATNIELLKDGNIYDTLATNVTGSTWFWTIPNTLPADNNYLIRVSSCFDSALNDVSNTGFSIAASSGVDIEVQQPNGGEQWVAGSSYLISWIDDIQEPVNIVLMQAGVVVDTIELNVSGSTYVWDIPGSQPAGTNYKVKIYSTQNAFIMDVSDDEFTIFAQPILNIYPNPSNNYFTIEFNKPREYHVEMFNRLNNKVVDYVVAPSQTELQISTQNMPNGIYFIVTTFENKRTIKKIIINH